MSSDPANPGEALLERARSGSDAAYRELIEVHRAELHAHCYRILGSVQDAEDALQDALLRAWRGLAGFEVRSSVRSWLYKITTNAALDVAQRRSGASCRYGRAAVPLGERGRSLRRGDSLPPLRSPRLAAGLSGFSDRRLVRGFPAVSRCIADAEG
jgi:DNA-directed RNA polymerase specialized sigma24 family protein